MEGLDHLRHVAWPDFNKLERVHLYDLNDEKKFFNAWRLRGDQEELVLVMPTFLVTRMRRNSFSRVEVFDYADELNELVRLTRNAKTGGKRPFDSIIFSDHLGGGPPYDGGIYHGCAAAFLGQEEIATALVHEALKSGDQFPLIYDSWAFHEFYRGVELLQNGAARRDVLASWEESLKLYPHSRYREQLLDYTATLREQTGQEKELLATAVDDPEELPIEERIAYYIARFPDVQGRQLTQPGHCLAVGHGPPRKESGTWLSDSVVEIGGRAVPVLIEHLIDRRLTRSVGFRRNFEPSRTVLRVQDVALQCIERILDVHIYSPSDSSSYLSTESPETRNQVIADIRAMWRVMQSPARE
jgi:hypothetical protein